MDATLALYESMGRLSAEMAAAARANDWDTLCQLEEQVADMRNELMLREPLGRPSGLSESERQHKASLIRQILADDREIRAHAEPWMESVRVMLAAGSRRNALNAAYGATS